MRYFINQFFFLDNYKNIDKIIFQNIIFRRIRYNNKIIITITFSDLIFIFFKTIE